MRRGIRVQCASYNGDLGQATQDLTAWLIPTLSKTAGDSSVAPDIFAVGFQEVLPLSLALSGLTKPVLTLHHERILASIQKLQPYNYTLITQKIIGGTALLLFARDGGVLTDIANVQVGKAACGVFNIMGNKGAVAARLEFKTGEVMTFVVAHLTPHAGNFERRKEDFKTIVKRLVFTNERSGGTFQMYDTNYLFFFGDLNFRLQNVETEVVKTAVGSSTTSISLLKHDELTSILQEPKSRDLFSQLQEPDVSFRPTYKFKTGQKGMIYHEKRLPAWCDRILFASSNELPINVEGYISIEEFVDSDHKPVTARFYIPSTEHSDATLQFLRCPYPIDPNWRILASIGLILDRIVGFTWALVAILVHPGSLTRGFLVGSLVGIIGLWWSGISIGFK